MTTFITMHLTWQGKAFENGSMHYSLIRQLNLITPPSLTLFTDDVLSMLDDWSRVALVFLSPAFQLRDLNINVVLVNQN